MLFFFSINLHLIEKEIFSAFLITPICFNLGIPVLIVGITAGATKLENYTSRVGSELM